jgi:phage tail P2-like protein
MDIKNLSLLELQTESMKKDPTTIAMCAALEPLLKQIANDIDKTIIIGDIDNVSEAVLDELAWQWHVDFYEGTAEQKRQLVKNALIIHLTKGTPFAVETLIATIFGQGRVEEWFEYSGQPYHFRVIVDNTSATGEQADKFIRMLESVKNKRSKLDQIVIGMSAEFNIYTAAIVHTGDTLTLRKVV